MRPGVNGLSLAVLPSTEEKIPHLVMKYQRVTVRQLLTSIGISHESVTKILHSELGMTKVSAQWVPRFLTRCTRSSYHPRVYPPYSPDLAQSDFHHFPLMIKALGEQHFETNC